MKTFNNNIFKLLEKEAKCYGTKLNQIVQKHFEGQDLTYGTLTVSNMTTRNARIKFTSENGETKIILIEWDEEGNMR